MNDQPKLTPVSAMRGLYRSPVSVTARATELQELLGLTAEQVAANLLRAGCYGVRGECGTCPIAEFFMKSDLNPGSVEVAGDLTLRFPTDQPGGEDYVVNVPFTDAVRQFVIGFDQGNHPELIAPAVTA